MYNLSINYILIINFNILIQVNYLMLLFLLTKILIYYPTYYNWPMLILDLILIFYLEEYFITINKLHFMFLNILIILLMTSAIL